MADIVSVSDLINRLSGGGSGNPQFIPLEFLLERWTGSTLTTISGLSGSELSLFRSVGSKSNGAAPTTVENPTSATAGAIAFVNASGGRQLWLTNVEISSDSSQITWQSMSLYDRLLHIGGLDGTSTGAQTVAGTLSRNTGGVGNRIFLEIYTSIGSTATSATVSYTNQDGTTGRTGTIRTVGGEFEFNLSNVLLPVVLQAGDTGVRAVASVTLAATTGTVGDFGITIAHPLLDLPIDGNPAVREDLTAGWRGPVEVVDDACLMMSAVSYSGTSEEPFYGSLTLVEA